MKKPKTIGEWIYPLKSACSLYLVIWHKEDNNDPLWEGFLSDFPMSLMDLKLDYNYKGGGDYIPIDFRHGLGPNGKQTGFVILVKD